MANTMLSMFITDFQKGKAQFYSNVMKDYNKMSNAHVTRIQQKVLSFCDLEDNRTMKCKSMTESDLSG